MKRTWDPADGTHTYGQASSSQTTDDNKWMQSLTHPYASAYTNMGSYQPTTQNPGSFKPSSYSDKRPRLSEGDLARLGGDDDDGEDDDDEDDDEDGEEDGGSKSISAKKGSKGKGDKPKTKLTRGSRACIPCRKIKMRCIPDESNPTGPCRRCKTGGHECVFEESNRGKRSTRKNEALTARLSKMEGALRSIGGALSNLDQPALNSFSTALHTVTSDPDMIQLITSHTAPSVVPTLAVAMNRNAYSQNGYDVPGQMRGEDAAHLAHPPLSPRLHSLPDNALSPLGLLAEASLHNADSGKKPPQHITGQALLNTVTKPHRPSPLGQDGRSSPRASSMHRSGSQYRMATSDIRGGSEEDGRGVASHNYFKPGQAGPSTPGIFDDRIPELLTIVSREEIGELFEIYFEHMSPHVPVLYKEFHTPDLVLQRSQFLCTVVCAISARYSKRKQDIRPQLSAYAKRLAFEVPSRGYKSVEVCQAYLLLSVWTLGPEKTFEQDRTWLMLGMAIRMATDLNLHRKSLTSGLDTEEGRARDLEIINRERTWLLCFTLDRSISAQMGKPYTLREDYIIRNACEAAWHQQRFSLPADPAMAAYVVLQQIMSRAIDSIYSSTQTVSGLRQDCDYMLIVRSAHEELRRWLTEWNNPDKKQRDSQQEYDSRAQFYFAYSSLVLYSFGLENALERAKMDISFFLTNVYEAATRVCTVIKEHFLPKGYLPYLPDTNFVMCSYALLSLLKLLKPELRPYHDSEEAILKLVSEVADILEDCAVDPQHQPAIYAAFIREIVRRTKETRNGASIVPSRMGSPAPQASQTPLGQNAVGSTNDTLYDAGLLNDANWHSDGLDAGMQFTFIPQGGDMMILPSAAGPSDSIANSPTTFQHPFTPTTSAALAALANVNTNPQGLAAASALGGAPGQTGAAATGNSGWAEYLPTFMSSDGFDGWDGSMLLPGFGRGQITLGGGLLHSQFGSGIM